MTLQEIFDILDKNIKDNGGTLKLSSTMIASPSITKIFDEYLLNKDLEVLKAAPQLNSDNVTVTGEGNSLIFFKTTIKSLVFTVDDALVPSMTVNAEAIIKDKDGWTFGSSFPVLGYSNWGGFYDPADKDKTKWIQKLFYESAEMALSEKGLSFSGIFLFKDGLEPLSVLFKGNDKVRLQGNIKLNKGTDGYKVTPATIMPETFLRADIGDIQLPLGSFNFKLSFGLHAFASIIKKGKEIGRPGAGLEILIQSTIPVNNEELGVSIGVGSIAGALTMRIVLPEKTEIGMSELISLANNSNVLAVMPSNIPVIDVFVLKDWQLTFNTKEKTISQLVLAVATRESFEWQLIPGVITLKYLSFWLGVSYFNKKADPTLTIEGTIGIGPNGSIRFDISASFPSYVFKGSLDPETPIDLREILIYFLGPTIGSSLPDTLKLGVLEISIDPKNTTYSLTVGITTDLQIPVVLTTIVVRSVLFNIDYVAGQPTGSIEGELKIGTSETSPSFLVSAAYGGPEDGWTFSGALMQGSEIKLKEIIDTYLPAEYHQFNVFDITIQTLSLTFTQGPAKRYEFLFAALWILDLGLVDPFNIKAAVRVAFDSKKPAGKQYEGYIDGSLEFGNIKVGARVDFKEGSKDYTFYFNGFQAKLTKNPQGDSILCFTITDNTTLGDLITMLVNAATGDDITLPSPWNVMNNIKLKDFSFSFNITKKKIGLTYTPSMNLGFIEINEITLFYTYGGEKPIVEIAITKGKFLGGAQPLPQPWNVLDPSKAPAVPGKGTKLFRLDFLGLGQHVSLKSGLNPNSVSEAVKLLKDNFEKKTSLEVVGDASPIGSTGLRFNSNSNWLIGTEFVILETFNLGIVFFDPEMYGLAIYVNGPKAKVFQGLKFEILYKKVTDTVGVYQIYLKLPDAIRQMDFGSVSVTLPSIRLYIYTNGDFKVDLGFPLNDNFSESFGLQMLPFVGAGGFYIGFLSAATASNVPATTKGNFSPVIVFGIGLRVGIGKEINKGILKAGLSLTVQGILEGTFAQYNAFQGNGTEDEVYYFIVGKIAIVGHLYGGIDFAIISAEVDIKLFISARVVIETREPILITFEAGVSVSLKVKINLGIFSFSISLSFSTTLRESFTIGRRSDKPWGGSLSVPFRMPALRALDTDEECLMMPLMNWKAIIPDKKVDLPMLYVPQMSVANTKEDPSQSPRMTAMLYLETSVGQPLHKLKLKSNDGEEMDDPFTKFAKGVFLWVLGAYINKTGEDIPVETIMNTRITGKNLSEILCYFNAKDQLQPFTAKAILAFMEKYLNITITVPPRVVEDEQQVSIFPMLPILLFKTPEETIYFDDEKAKYRYDAEQLKLIRDLFRELSARASNKQQAGPTSTEEEKQSLASFMFVDYVAMLGKEAVQRGLDRLELHKIPAPEGKSLNDIVNENPGFGISAQELAFSNRTRPLNSGVGLRVTGVKYTVKEGDTLDTICHRLNIQRNELLRMNTFTRTVSVNPCSPSPLLMAVPGTDFLDAANRLLPGTVLQLPGILHTTSANRADTLLSVANQYAVNVHSLVTENLDVPDLFATGKNIRIPYAESLLVKELIQAMDENFDFEHMAGLSANIMLQGLRVPLPEADSKIGKPEALYVVTGQEVNASTFAIDQQLSLELEATLPWLNLGAEGGISLPFTLLEQDVNGMQSLAGTLLTPRLTQLQALNLYDIQSKRYTLPSHIEWQSPQAITLVNGSNHFQQTIDPCIWAFKNSLQALISGANAFTPKVELLLQVQETINITSDPVPVQNYSWSTTINLHLRQVRKAENPTQLMPNVYEVQSIDQGSMALLRNLVDYYGKHPGTAIIKEIQFLYSKDRAKDGQEKPPTGLRSDSINNTTVFLLQTNLSTLSNPSPMLARLNAGDLGEQQNLLGMTQIEFLRFLWEAAIVGTGGYYFYYLVNDSKNGLPDYLFNDDKDATITLVITYDITDNVLQNFLNSVVIRDQVDITSEILYVQTVAVAIANDIQFDNRIDVKVATVPSGCMGFDMKRKNPVTRTDVPQLEKDLEELYNLLEYNIAPTNDFEESPASLPAGPGDKSYKPPKDPDVVVRPAELIAMDWDYSRIVRVYPFAKPVTPQPLPSTVKHLLAHEQWKELLSGDDIPPEKENPYRATGKTVQLDMRWVDIFGNLTKFTNTSEPNVPVQLPPVTIGYIDPVTAIDQYPSLTAAYIIEKNEANQPVVRVTLAFNPSKYQPTEKDPDGWKERARVDREAYKSIYYQLVQDDVRLTVTNTLQASVAGNEAADQKATLLAFVLEIYQYLGKLLLPKDAPARRHEVGEGETLSFIADAFNTNAESLRRANPHISLDGQLQSGQLLTIPEIDAPADKFIVQPVSDTNPLALFAVVTSLKLFRNENLVDKNFKDEPSVISATSIAGPDLRKPVAERVNDTDNSITIQEFVRKLESAFPQLKVASGLSQEAIEKDSEIDIWVIRFDKAANAIDFSILNKDKPFYFALQPLSTYLLSRDSVLIYPYTTGVPIYNNVARPTAFNGIDLEKMAEAFLSAVDVFLQADFSIPAWRIENAPRSATTGIDIPHPYQHIINAKKDLAKNIAKHLSIVLLDGNTPDDNNLQAAKDRLEQQLLIKLSDAYSIDTVLQFNVDVKSPYTDPSAIAPNLFGKVLDPADTSTPDQKAYAFSTTRFSLYKSDEQPVNGNTQRSYLTILFNTKKENVQALESSYFPINLQYEISSIEHDIHSVSGIPDYKSSSWLSFILPFTHEHTALGNLKIPIPLRAYPTAPSLTAQRFIPHCPQFSQQLMMALHEEDKLPVAKAWDYEYTYDYVRAQQDTIYTDILLNMQQPARFGLFKDDTDPDLFAALLQFNSAYPAIQADLNQYLMDQSNPQYAFTAMQSFAWLAGRVAKAWGNWVEQKKMYADPSVGEENYKYQVIEGYKEVEGQTALTITVTPRGGTTFRLPEIHIAGYEIKILQDTSAIKEFAYYKLVDGNKKYLSPSEAVSITQRSIRFNGFNIIQQENAWSGLSIVRNKILVPNIETNSDFIYETPVIRFVNNLTPLLDPDIDINMAAYSPSGKNKLQVYLSNFFRAFFDEIAGKTTTRVVKTAVNYSYTHGEDPDGLRVDIPISITTPYDFRIPADWDIAQCADMGGVDPSDTFVCQLTALLTAWFNNNRPVQTNGKFQFDVSLFASLSNSQLPVLHIRRIILDINIVDFG